MGIIVFPCFLRVCKCPYSARVCDAQMGIGKLLCCAPFLGSHISQVSESCGYAISAASSNVSCIGEGLCDARILFRWVTWMGFHITSWMQVRETPSSLNLERIMLVLSRCRKGYPDLQPHARDSSHDTAKGSPCFGFSFSPSGLFSPSGHSHLL